MAYSLPARTATWAAWDRSRRVLVPPPRLPLAAWIEQHMRLPGDVAASPGPIRLWPFQRGIADAIGDPDCERVTLVKSVRVGLSTLLTAAIGSYVANDPSPILLLLPTEADCRDYAVSDLDSTFAASPIVAQALTDDTSGGTDRNTLLSRRFAGGSLKIVAARAPRNLRRHNVRVLLCDEIDGYETGSEGNPLALAERRTLSFPNRKLVFGSTPVFEDTSNVLRSYATSDMRVYECPCPSCGVHSEILWGAIEWLPDRPETAAFRCPQCSELIGEDHKPAMVALGRWRATRPEVKNHAGFRINALVSPHIKASWAALAAEFLTAKNSPDTLQVFVNTILAQGWKSEGESIDEGELQSRAEPFSLEAIPAAVLLVTGGADIQRDRIELTTLGHSKEGDTYILDHTVLYGLTNDNAVWGELNARLKERWRHPLGGTLGYDAALVDAGDGAVFDRVVDFCQPLFNRRIVACKGMAGTRPALEFSKATMGKGKRLALVGVDGLKLNLMNRLAKGQTIRFSHTLSASYYEQLTSERRVVRYVRGQPAARFERIVGRQAEALDCFVYAAAAKVLVASIGLDRRRADLSGFASPPLPTVIRSAWLDRGART